MAPRVSSAAAATEFHSLSPPCVHSAETPGPLIAQPGALAAVKLRYEGFRSGSCRDVSVMPRMFSASYQRYSGTDGGTFGRGDAETMSFRSNRSVCEAWAAPRERMTKITRIQRKEVLSLHPVLVVKQAS